MESSINSSIDNPYKPNFQENDINQQEQHPYYFDFPTSPHIHLEYEDVYLQFLEHFYQIQSKDQDYDNINPVVVDQEPITGRTDQDHMNKEDVINQTMKRRHSRKDRHSKIKTVNGLRDRRMRLSLDIARKFFDLQDMLEYDKASRTVEWLLNKSKTAIEELRRSRGTSVCSASSTSVDDCDVVSSNQEPLPLVPVISGSCISKSKSRRKKIIKVVLRKNVVSKESRIKARERARERTSQKRRLSQSRTDQFRQFRCGVYEGGDML